MKKVLMIALALLTLGSQMEVAAEKKEKKEKKGLKWDWDGQTLSGNKEIDTYIKTIDTLYNKVQSYVDSLSKYKMVDTLVIVDKTGQKYEVAYMEDEEGRLVTRGTVNWQCVQAAMQGANIVLDMTNAGLMSANAALTLPKLGPMKAIKFGKYVKGGPAVISAGTKAIKDVRKKWISNARKWKDMKVAAVDPKSFNYEGMTDALADKLNKCVYIRKIENVSETTQQANNESQRTVAMGDFFGQIDQQEQAREDARQSNENLDGFNEFLNGDDGDDA